MLGYLDDLLILPALAAITVKLLPEDIMEENRRKAEKLLENGKPKKWYYAIPIILFWILVLLLIVKAIRKSFPIFFKRIGII